MAQWQIRDGRALDRLVFFSDAVVAVAITVLVLPLVDIAGPKDGQSMMDVIREHSGEIITFFFTFCIVAILWSVHNRVMNVLQGFDGTIFWLDMAWLAGFAFLPWPSALFGAGARWGFDNNGAGDGGVPAFYWLTMAYISAIGMVTTWHVNRHRELIEPSRIAYWDFTRSSRSRYRGPAFTLLFLIGGIASAFWVPASVIVPYLILVLEFLLRPTKSERLAYEKQFGNATSEGQVSPA